MFNLSNLLNTLDNAAKETLQSEGETPMSATSLRSAVKDLHGHSSGSLDQLSAPKQESSSSLSSIQTEAANGEDGDESQALEVEASSSTAAKEESKDSTTRAKPARVGSGGASSKVASADLKAKDDEIERLNAECLELEDNVASLKTEVQEAWNSYQAAQEKAAARETELQEEIRALQKAKKTDKQQILAHITSLGNDRDEALRSLRAAQAERQDALDMLESARSHEREWQEREAALLTELNEARAGSVQGVQGLRDELRSAAALTEQLRNEHASLLRQSQARQAELEGANTELVQGLADKQRELSRARSLLEAGARDDSNAQEIELLQQQARRVSEQLDEERERRVGAERRVKQLEAEARAAVLNWDDERQRLETQLSEAATAQHALQDKARRENANIVGPGGTPLRPGTRVYGGEGEDDAYVVVGTGTGAGIGIGIGSGGVASGGIGSPGVVGAAGSSTEEIKNLVAQVQNLSKQLLGKQSAVNDLQAERSALKSRVLDLQARCANAERQLSSMRDLEEDDVAADRDRLSDGSGSASGFSGNSNGMGSAGFGLQQRRKGPGGAKVMADLEKMGVHAGPGISHVVDSIDSWTLVTGK